MVNIILSTIGYGILLYLFVMIMYCSYRFGYKPLRNWLENRKSYLNVEKTMKQIDEEHPVKNIKKDKKLEKTLREERERALINANLSPSEIQYYQKNKEENKNVKTKEKNTKQRNKIWQRITCTIKTCCTRAREKINNRRSRSNKGTGDSSIESKRIFPIQPTAANGSPEQQPDTNQQQHNPSKRKFAKTRGSGRKFSRTKFRNS